jgi:hypothetical protein
MRNATNTFIYWYVNLPYYKQCRLLHVSATYCGHLQGDILWRMYYIERQNNLIYKYKSYILNKSVKSILKYKILIKLYVLTCMLICCVCGDTTSTWLVVSPYQLHKTAYGILLVFKIVETVLDTLWSMWEYCPVMRSCSDDGDSWDTILQMWSCLLPVPVSWQHFNVVRDGAQ